MSRPGRPRKPQRSYEAEGRGPPRPKRDPGGAGVWRSQTPDRNNAPGGAGGWRSQPPDRNNPPRPSREPEAEQRWVYGVNPVLETLRARPDVVERLWLAEGELRASAAAEIFTRAKDAGVRIEKVPRERLTSLVGRGVHQGVVAEVRAFEYAELEDLIEKGEAADEPALIVVLDGVQDPQNLGAIIRSAHALGALGVVIPKDRAAGLTGFVAKASAGALAHCPVARVVNLSRALEQLHEAGLWRVAADPRGDQTLWEAKLDGPLALVIGGEGPGVREGVLKHCDFRVQIPMLGKVGSLNASVSAAVLLYEVTRQRAHG